MSVVQVFGFVPDPEFGEVPFASYVYDIFVDKKDGPQFLVWNPYINKWKIVEGSMCRPLAVPPQDIHTKRKMEECQKLIARRQKDEKAKDLPGRPD